MDVTSNSARAVSDSDPWVGFLTGPENALASAALLALARGELVGIAPVVLHGPAGSGKSRLLGGLVAEWLRRRPDSAVGHVDAEEFVAACADAAAKPGGWSELRSRFRDLDLFVLEELHELDRAPLALTELVATLDALEAAGAIVAVSARSGPGEWSGWPRRLVNRLRGGLALRVDPPGPALRRRYLLARAQERGLRLSADAVEALAETADGFRTLDGWLAELALSARIGREPSPLGRRAIEPILAVVTESRPPLTVRQIAHDVARAFGVSVRDLRSASRRPAVVGPRQIAMHLARELTSLSFQSIGNYFGGRDPATVRHSCRTAAGRIDADPALAAAAAVLRNRWHRAE
jgi:chromosomal replication initiator protein